MTAFQRSLNHFGAPYEEDRDYCYSQSPDNFLDGIFQSSPYSPCSPSTSSASSDIVAIVQELLSSSPSSPATSVLSLDTTLSFNGDEVTAQPEPDQYGNGLQSAPEVISLDSIAPGTVISDGRDNHFEIVVENGQRKFFPIVIAGASPLDSPLKIEKATPPSSPESIGITPVKKLAQNRKASQRYRDKKKADEKNLEEELSHLKKEQHRQELLLERKKAKKELLLNLISQKFPPADRVVY